MSRKIVINKLNKEELTYELTVRGIGTGTVEDMRKRLSQAFQLEKGGDSFKHPRYPFAFEEDVEAVSKKLEDIKPVVRDFRQSRKSPEAVKIRTKFAHILGRIDNMAAEEEEELEKKSSLLATLLSLMDEFETRLDDFDKTSPHESLLASVLARNLDPEAFAEDIQNASRSSDMEEVPRPSTSSTIKPTPPSKWNIKFSGNLKEMSLNSFFEKIEELRIARNVSKDILLDSGAYSLGLLPGYTKACQ
ncbi:hypothetical protein NQ317_010168 [Molorchus minor]|uniref:Uncharacterized protein n=1 Tax=Molorchus minor TaxID=1323400 RepID=A0ABQ9IUP0_9CUCU|nr:hypothetical protein NQ317_010168 [Molorchus minor]